MFFFDTETCGFHGPMVLMQYAWDDGPINLHHVWGVPIIDTLLLIEEACNHEGGVCGFNLAFDWFHMQKTYNCLSLLADKVGMDALPIEHINAYAECESAARDGVCIKPHTALDLMLYARKGPYQSTMDRKDIRIKKVPRVLAYPLAQELERRIPLPDIYFSKRKDKTATKWKVFPIKNAEGKEDLDFVDIVLKFAASSSLKVLAVDAGVRKMENRLMFSDLEELKRPMELGWAPFATAISSAEKNWFVEFGKKKGFAWPKLILDHYLYWKHDSEGQRYAYDDVVDTRGLYDHFDGPEPGDDDSLLACMVGSVRWRGYAVDLEAIEKLRLEETVKAAQAPKAPAQVHYYLSQVMDDTEITSFTSTKRVVLEGIEAWKKDCSCVKTVKREGGEERGFGEVSLSIIHTHDRDCKQCAGTGKIKHPAAERAQKVLEARKGFTKKVLYEKLKQAGRLHPAASVIGSLSGRMSGRTEVSGGRRSSNINALGIQHDKIIRRCFPLAHGDLVLTGGDFDAYEVGIADAAYDDPDLRKALLTCAECGEAYNLKQYGDVTLDHCPHCGYGHTACKNCKKTVAIKDGNIKSTCCDNPEPYDGTEITVQKIHGLFAMELYPGKTYDDILATKGQDPDLYDNGKRGIFSQFYGGDENTLVTRIGIDKEDAILASNNFKARYKGVGQAYIDCYEDHCSMRQPAGIGTQVEWFDPKEYVESLNGFQRYFTLENKITKALYTLAESPPKAWTQMKLKVVRREREQKVSGAIRSALFAAAFQIQAQCMRAALNHKIQSTGAIETKNLQCRIWTLQPPGAHSWHVQPLNVHDELMCPCLPPLAEPIKEIVDEFIVERRSLIPLLKMDWSTSMKNWAEKT